MSGVCPAMPGCSRPVAPYRRLEDGIQIQFQVYGTYTRGDFWLIPARTATGDIEGGNDPRRLDGVAYHLAPLAFIALNNGKLSPIDLRCQFPQLCAPPFAM
jgi:hypothetical protein